MSLNRAISKLEKHQVDFMLKNSKRQSHLLNYDFESLHLGSWKFLKETAPELIKLGNFEKLIVEVFRDRKIGIFVHDVNNSDYNDCLYFIFWIIDEIRHWNKTEVMILSSDPDPKQIAAGINELTQFGNMNTIDSLVVSWQGAYTHEQVKEMPYYFLFDKQYKSKIENNIQRKLAKMK